MSEPTKRPDPPHEPPEGMRWRPRVATDWRALEPGDVRRCRYGAGYHKRACGAPAVAVMNRGARARRASWWAYCADPVHMYGRWVEDGKVMQWVLVGQDDES